MKIILGFFTFLTAIFAYENLDLVKSTKQYNVISKYFNVTMYDQPFYLEIHDLQNNLLQSTQNIPIQLGQWIGKSFQKYIYEGYSFRLGFIVKKIRGVNIRSVYKSSNESVICKLDTVEQGVYIFVEIKNVLGQRIAIDVRIDPNSNAEYNRILWGLQSSKDEQFFGFGERFVSAQNRKGKQFYDWVEDGGFGLGTELRLPKGDFSTYIPIPWGISTKNYGMFLNTTYRTRFDLKPEKQILYMVETNSSQLILYFSKSAQGLLSMYTQEIGRSLIPPKFGFGMWDQLSTQLPNSSTVDPPHDKQVSALRTYILLDIPVSLQKQEEHFLPAGSQIGKEQQIKEANQALLDLGVPNNCYLNPMIAETYASLYNEAKEKGYFVRNSKGKIAKFYYKGAGSIPFYVSMLDFTNPGTVEFWHKIIQGCIDLGYKGWMQDYGEYVDPSQRFFNGMEGDQVHNNYVHLYHKATTDYLVQQDIEKYNQGYAPDIMFYVRSGYTETQKDVWGVWTGDPSSDFTNHSGMPAQLSAMISAGLTGINFIGSDIGGFVYLQSVSLELWVRWLQLGLLSPLMEIQGGGTPLFTSDPKMHPTDWYDGWTSMRLLSKMRMQLFPYLYEQAHIYRKTGKTLIRHHVLNFQDDFEALKQNYQYMFGDLFLVAPVMNQNQTQQSVYLPAKVEWFDFSNNIVYNETDGRFTLKWAKYYYFGQGQYVNVTADLVRKIPPMFIKGGSILILQDPTVQTIHNATNKTVVDQFSREYIHHLMIFYSDRVLMLTENYQNLSISMSKIDKDNSCQLSVSDPLNRIFTVQIRFETIFSGKWNIKSGSQVAQESTYDQIISLDKETSNLLFYYWDNDIQILWVRYSGCNQSGKCESQFQIQQLQQN